MARTIVLSKLTVQARSRQELEQALEAKAVPADVATRVLDRLTEVGLVDDEAFAGSWVHSRRKNRGLGRRALSYELRRKGVDEELIRETLDQVTPEDEQETAAVLVRRKLRSMGGLSREVQVRRLAGMLARKGFGAGMAMSVIRKELRRGAATDVPEHTTWTNDY